MPKKVLLVGGGITSAITGNLLRCDIENINLSLWEKLSEAGGRFNTITGGKNNELLVDLGAQYITTSEEIIKNYSRIYSDLFLNNLITLMETKVKGMRHLSENKKNYIVPLGMKSIFDNFLSHAKLNSICYDQKLSKLHIRNDKWNAITDSGKEELFDVVILTIPVPEILKITGDLESLLCNDLVRKRLSAVEYSSRFALGLFFDEGVFTEWDAEYIDNDSILRYTANDCWKAHGERKFKSAVIHTTIQFGEKYKENDIMQVKEIIMKHVQKVFKHWPEPSSTVICQWNHSQVFRPYYSKPGSVILNEKPLLIAGGDGFIGSTFDDCIFSAKTICNILSNNY